MSFAGVWGAVLFLAVVSSIVSLWLHVRTGSFHDLQTQVRALARDVEDLYDAVEKWGNREKVRNLRAGKAAAAAPLTPQPGTPEYKSYLRQLAKGQIVKQ